jgi:hypothetical protein
MSARMSSCLSQILAKYVTGMSQISAKYATQLFTKSVTAVIYSGYSLTKGGSLSGYTHKKRDAFRHPLT